MPDCNGYHPRQPRPAVCATAIRIRRKDAVMRIVFLCAKHQAEVDATYSPSHYEVTSRDLD